jgi:hypothetical protein
MTEKVNNPFKSHPRSVAGVSISKPGDPHEMRPRAVF